MRWMTLPLWTQFPETFQYIPVISSTSFQDRSRNAWGLQRTLPWQVSRVIKSGVRKLRGSQINAPHLQRVLHVKTLDWSPVPGSPVPTGRLIHIKLVEAYEGNCLQMWIVVDLWYIDGSTSVKVKRTKPRSVCCLLFHGCVSFRWMLLVRWYVFLLWCTLSRVRCGFSCHMFLPLVTCVSLQGVHVCSELCFDAFGGHWPHDPRGVPRSKDATDLLNAMNPEQTPKLPSSDPYADVFFHTSHIPVNQIGEVMHESSHFDLEE